MSAISHDRGLPHGPLSADKRPLQNPSQQGMVQHTTLPDILFLGVMYCQNAKSHLQPRDLAEKARDGLLRSDMCGNHHVAQCLMSGDPGRRDEIKKFVSTTITRTGAFLLLVFMNISM